MVKRAAAFTGSLCKEIDEKHCVCLGGRSEKSMLQHALLLSSLVQHNIHLACPKSGVPLSTLKLHSGAYTFKEAAKKIACTWRYVISRIRRDFGLQRARNRV